MGMVRTVEFIQKSTYIEIPDENGEMQVYAIPETIEGVQELVRCKDCKYWSAERINDFNKCRRWINVGVKNFATMGDWYCADGESKSADEILMEEMDADPLG